MSSITKILSFLVISFLICSCDDEYSNSPLIDNVELVSIEETLTIDNNTEGSNTYMYPIDNNLNTHIESVDGYLRNHTYEEGKLVLAEYFNEGSPSITKEYQYDSNDRLKKIITYSSEGNQTDVKTYIYDGNQILCTSVEYDSDGGIESEHNYVFTLNSDNQFILFESLTTGRSWEVTYSNNNVSTFAYYDGDTMIGSAVFNYTDQVITNPQLQQGYQFGPQWKNNVIIGLTGQYSFKTLAELGQNYIQSYTFTYALLTDGSQTTLESTYEFDDRGRLIKKVNNIMWLTTPLNSVRTYQYE